MPLGHSPQSLLKRIATVPQNDSRGGRYSHLLAIFVCVKFNTLYHITVIGRFIRSADFLGTFGRCLFLSKTNNKKSEPADCFHASVRTT